MGNIDISKMGFSGKMGPIVAYVVNGKQRFRTYVEPRNPNTPKQKSHRSNFGFVSSMVSPLFEEIKIGYKNDSLNYGTVCGKVGREAVTGKFPDITIDYSKIQIAEGKLQPPTMATVIIDAETNIADFKWNTDIEPKSYDANDKVNIVCFNEANPTEIFRKSNFKRKAGNGSIELPKHWGASDTHCWIYFSSFNLNINSDSVYITF